MVFDVAFCAVLLAFGAMFWHYRERPAAYLCASLAAGFALLALASSVADNTDLEPMSIGNIDYHVCTHPVMPKDGEPGRMGRCKPVQDMEEVHLYAIEHTGLAGECVTSIVPINMLCKFYLPQGVQRLH